MRRLVITPGAALAAILIIAASVRMAGISARPIWYDEAFSILFAEKGPAAMLEGTLTNAGSGAAEEHPLGYYVILWGWIGVFGQSLVSVRLLSIAAGTAATGLVYLTGREMFSEKTGRLAGFFAALAPFQIHYSQEIRMYVFLCLWLLLATYAFLRGSRSRRAGWWILFTLSAALAQYTQPGGPLSYRAGVTPTQRRLNTVRSVAWSGLAAIVLYIPWLLQLPAQVAKVGQAYWIERPGFENIFRLLLIYTTILPLPDRWLFPGLFIALTVSAIALWETMRMMRGRNPEAMRGLWLLHLAFTPPLLALLASLWRPLFLERTFIASGAIYCIWLAWTLSSSGLPRLVRGLILMLLITGAVIGIQQHVTYRGFPYAPYKEMGVSLQRNLRSDEIIVHSSKLSLLPTIYFERELEQVYVIDPPGSNVDTLAPATQKALGIRGQPDIESAARDARNVRLIIFQQSIGSTRMLEATHPHIAWLDEHYQLTGVEHWGDLLIYRYKP
jgi:uncharacterized membrane protein